METLGQIVRVFFFAGLFGMALATGISIGFELAKEWPIRPRVSQHQEVR